jgi:protein SCO1/2
MRTPVSNSDRFVSCASRVGLAAFALASLLVARPAVAQFSDPDQNIGVRPELLKDVSIDQRLNEQVPLDLHFRDEHGHPVVLSQYFDGKPVVLSLVYFTCPMLCTDELNGLDRTLKVIPMDIGKDYNVLTVSIDPTDSTVVADAKQTLYTSMYGRPGAAAGWHFLTGEDSQIKALAAAVGYHYAYDAQSKQFAHAAGVMILTPEGKLSRYLYGINYGSRDMRLALTDASDGKIGSPVDAVLLFCYHYDPHTGKYGLIISRVVQIGAGLTILFLGALLFVLTRSGGNRFAVPHRHA